jgi:hypothetical protein
MPDQSSCILEIEQDTDSSLDNFEGRLHKVYDDTDADELAGYIRQRWNKFATFRRAGNTGSVVMKGGHGMVADFVQNYLVMNLYLARFLLP